MIIIYDPEMDPNTNGGKKKDGHKRHQQVQVHGVTDSRFR